MNKVSRTISKIVVIIGVIGVLAFFSPVVLGILGELLCGGMIILSDMGLLFGTIVGITLLYIILRFIYKGASSYIKKKKNSPILYNTFENQILQGVDYCNKSRASGMNDESIRELLAKNGWDDESINIVFSRL